jgi:hypothetical protein
MIERLGDIVCDLHRTREGDEKSGVSGLASKSVATVCQWFGLKTTAMVWPQNYYDGFLVWALKPRSMVWCFGPQNHHDSFLVWASKPSGRRFVGLGLKTNEWTKTV